MYVPGVSEPVATQLLLTLVAFFQPIVAQRIAHGVVGSAVVQAYVLIGIPNRCWLSVLRLGCCAEFFMCQNTSSILYVYW